MNLKSLLTMILLLAVSLMASAQVRYIYDPAGNRVTRGRISINSPSTEFQQGNEAYGLSHSSDMLGERNIRIYPNPTTGNLKIEILNYAPDDICDLSFCTIVGYQIASVHLTSPSTTLDITDQKNGLYLLQIQLNGLKRAWKIIKK